MTHERGLAESTANDKPTPTKRAFNDDFCVFKAGDPWVLNFCHIDVFDVDGRSSFGVVIYAIS